MSSNAVEYLTSPQTWRQKLISLSAFLIWLNWLTCNIHYPHFYFCLFVCLFVLLIMFFFCRENLFPIIGLTFFLFFLLVLDFNGEQVFFFLVSVGYWFSFLSLVLVYGVFRFMSTQFFLCWLNFYLHHLEILCVAKAEVNILPIQTHFIAFLMTL